jgi:hypothetical protein
MNDDSLGKVDLDNEYIGQVPLGVLTEVSSESSKKMLLLTMS